MIIIQGNGFLLCGNDKEKARMTKQSMSKKVGIILVNYKDYVNRFLKECRDSLRRQTCSQDNFIIYIVDNATSEQSREFIKTCYPEAVIIPRDDGNYSAANNAGIERAGQDGCEYFVIANMDALFNQNWLKELVGAMDSDNSIGIAQSKILLYPKNRNEWLKPKINSLGNIIHFLGFGFTAGYNETDYDLSGLPEIKGYASGCSFIIRKEVLDKIGGYNEEYYMYHDDLEVSWKARLAGYKIVLAPKSIIYHKYEFSRSVRMLFYMERNRYLAMFSFYRWPTLFLIMPAIITMDFGMLAFSVYGGWFKIKLNVYDYFLRPDNWRKILGARKMIKNLKIAPERELVKNFSGRILFQEVMNPALKYVANPLFNAYWLIVKSVIWW